MRVVLLDPASYTLPYDHQLAVALAGAGVDVELVASRFGFGEPPVPDGYARTELFYPASSRLAVGSPLRRPLRVIEHGVGLVRLRGVAGDGDVLHVQWAPLPQLDVRLLPRRRASAITAHDVLPRRTAGKRELWRRVYSRFARVVVHSEQGRKRLIRQVGVEPARIVVIPHPVFPGEARYEGDGRTLLALGGVRPYKQIDHAIRIARDVGARLLVVGRPSFDLGERLAAAHVEWRLGYVNDAAIDAALAEATVALFPYREELDQSGALLRALGAGVPVAAYDVGGMAAPVDLFQAGVVAPPDDLPALTNAVRRLLDDPAALEAARAGARRAAAELTWNASAAAHVALYEELLA